MTKQERINEIINGITSFKDEKYFKKDLLDEYLSLEKQVVETIFTKEHCEGSRLGLTNVYKHLYSLCEPYWKQISEEFKEFQKGSYEIVNQIRKLRDGDKGELKAYKSLQTMNCKCKIIRNVELKRDDRQVEIDLVVITQRAIFNIEVKNTKKNVKISEQGNYYTIGENIRLDSNIGEKMNNREYLLKLYLEEKGINNPKIENIIVFTNSNIDIQNEYEYLMHCCLSTLPHKIKNYNGHTIYNLKEVEAMYDCLNNQEYISQFAPEVDIENFVKSFATLIASLEELIEQSEIKKQKRKKSVLYKILSIFNGKAVKC